jgi:chaperonin GroES
VGNRVLFAQFAGQKVKVNGEEVTILKEDEILAIVE